MRIDAEQLIHNNDIVQVIGRYVTLKREGAEQVGICPFHDDTTSSLKVNGKKNVYKCFACGAGGDSIDFLMRMGRTFHEACTELNGGYLPESTNPEQREAKQAKPAPNSWKPVTPAPNEPTEFRHYRHGIASRSWAYLDQNGNVIGYVCRFDLEDGSKEILPYVFATDGNRSEWRWMGFEKPRPLYNLDKLTSYPKATVVVCEGEKTADAIQAELDPNKTISVTWIGGANGIDNADWSPLHGRNLIFWPDHDTEQKYPAKNSKAGQVKPWHEQPGNHAMLEINKILESHCQTRRWLNVPDEFPNKWDAADKEWTEGELRSFVLKNLTDIPEVPHYMAEEFDVEEPKTEPTKKTTRKDGPQNPPPPPIVPAQPKHEEGSEYSFALNDHFRMLGYDKDENSRLVYYFFSFDAKAVIKLSPSSMTKSNLMMLAPLNWWEQNFPGGKSSRIDADSAQQFLIFHSHQVGTFKEKFIRGRGAWVDEGKFIIHTGDVLLVNGDMMPLRSFRSRYVYEIGERLGLGMTDPLKAVDSSKLVERAKWILWEREINAYLLAGWCVIAPFCGILQWRPHIWVTGPAGSGKSWVMDNIVKRLLGDTALVVQGKTTEAGVRGLLQNDARAVLFDETDVDNNNDKERVQNVLALARSSSYHDGGQIGKGTQSGGSRTYTMRSCFAFSSIGVQLNQQSDRSRFSILGLLSFEGKRTKDDFKNFEIEWTQLVTDEYVKGLQSRTMSLLPVILKNSRTFADAVAHVIGQRRIGDQVGGMLAGAYSLTSTKEISYEAAIEWVKSRDWTDERGLELTKDEYRLFGRLMGFMTKVETEMGPRDRTIGELILIAARSRSELGVSSEMASNRLRRLGFRIIKDRVYISSTADSIVSMLRDTPWVNNYNKILERLPGAEKEEPMTYFPGIRSRGVSVLLSMVSEGSDMPIETPYSAQWMGDKDDCPF